MKKNILLLGVFFTIFMHPQAVTAISGIIDSKHNLSVSGPGDMKSLIETRICIFCHTPHNAFPQTPLWNKEIDTLTPYIPYVSSTMSAAAPSRPSGPSRLCLSCHDGTVALGDVLRPVEGIAMSGVTTISPDRASYLGTDLSDDHPVSFSYDLSAAANSQIEPTPPADLIFYSPDHTIHCSTCHDPHSDANGKFLVSDNRASQLCLKCHNKNGWQQTDHRTSARLLLSPLPGKDWTGWTTVADYGCESCHVPHSAGMPRRILLFENEEDNCLYCHNGNVASRDIASQFNQFSKHDVALTAGVHDPTETQNSPSVTGHVECVDCHDPHSVNSTTTASAPYVPGSLQGVAGVDSTGLGVSPALYEYEICFKCHSDYPQSAFSPIRRTVFETNIRFRFDIANPSFHPVTGNRLGLDLPSLNPPSTDPEVPSGLTANSWIYCTDCHSDNSGSKGPHGSMWAPILKRQYELYDTQIESPDNYSLCYRCHNRDSILNDASFTRHNLHIVGQQTSCDVCHDPHGIPEDGGATGSHTHLINFNTDIVLPTGGNAFPFFTDNGAFTGSCTLLCHGRDHNNLSYP